MNEDRTNEMCENENSREANDSGATEKNTVAPMTEPADKAVDVAEEYARRQGDFNSFYTYLVIASATIFMCGIAVAIIVNLIVGIIMAIAAPVVYWSFCADELKKKLGITYKTASGELWVTGCKATYGERFYIPARLLWYDVTELGESAFNKADNLNITCIYLPRSLKRIKKDAFVGCASLDTVCFEGDETLWSSIDGIDELNGITVTFNAEYPPLPQKPQKKTEKNKKSAG